jgi:hypothetical protein
MLGSAWRQTGVGVAPNCEGTLYFTINLLAGPE